MIPAVPKKLPNADSGFNVSVNDPKKVSFALPKAPPDLATFFTFFSVLVSRPSNFFAVSSSRGSFFDSLRFFTTCFKSFTVFNISFDVSGSLLLSRSLCAVSKLSRTEATTIDSEVFSPLAYSISPPKRSAAAVFFAVNPLVPNSSVKSDTVSSNDFAIYFLLVPVYKPNQAAPAPTTILTNPDCSSVGSAMFIYHITTLYNR